MRSFALLAVSLPLLVFGPASAEEKPGEQLKVKGPHLINTLVMHTLGDDYPYMCRCTAVEQAALIAANPNLPGNAYQQGIGLCYNDPTALCRILPGSAWRTHGSGLTAVAVTMGTIAIALTM
eukprot:TRINITY_DN43878_c0_g1_i1.p1 TRINITY_DN43878_c0_g1~~TRINITY_DN43878_c0_g1_i1.p1  ORF type:complete len:122 (-),score=15.28 TRINITY_DN43878_c0_g1_i1:101-466(-)